ncbi:MAG: WbqC family protein [Pseudomonas sp.]|uniref:WbqC family protein n=1 Tax=Pseudomonas sp. TaxID=306 RepID=UPI0030F05CFD
MSTVVISQPMYLPWAGMFEQLMLADDFVFFDDVQFAKGFINRVQYKTADGSSWLTVPLKKHPRDSRICDVLVADDSDWRSSHLRALELSLAGTPYFADAMGLAENLLRQTDLSFVEMLMQGFVSVADYYQLLAGKRLHQSSAFATESRKSALILELVQQVEGTRYVTGHGALNYLDHEAFEAAGVEVAYMNYSKREYPQKFPPFTPYVTLLDLVANCGRDGKQYLGSAVMPWRQAMAERAIAHE